MKIGALQLSGNLILAPMSGISDYPFRRIAMEHGCSLVFTEMVSAEGLLRKGKTFLRIGEQEHPISVQLFGAKPGILAEAAQMGESLGADIIDINMGCPARQVVEAGAGVDLMQFPEKVKEILTKVRKGVNIPLTIKIRSGWDTGHINAVEISRIAEDCGVNAICIHPRTKLQGFHGRADWNVIREVKRATHLPIIGNGDVTNPFLAEQMIQETSCDGVMIGRGALGKPWVFSLINSMCLEEKPAVPTLEDRQRMIHRHFIIVEGYYGERWAVKKFQKHVYWYTKGLPNCASFHSKLSSLRERDALIDTMHSYFDTFDGTKP
jgi:nifR3 family TIM-barrel protein